MNVFSIRNIIRRKNVNECKRKIEREARVSWQNVILKGDRALSKLITLLILNKKEFNHFFKSRSSDIVLLKLGNLSQNDKRYEARNTEREAWSSHMSEREACEENVRAKRADFFFYSKYLFTESNKYCLEIKNSCFNWRKSLLWRYFLDTKK